MRVRGRDEGGRATDPRKAEKPTVAMMAGMNVSARTHTYGCAWS
jgi:hypothetical protein